MLRAVRTRVNELLDKTINKGSEIGLGFVEVPDALIRLETRSRVPVDTPVELPPGTPVIDVFEKFGAHLLILGAPGAGKTTLLRKLARALVEQAQQDDRERIPVILELATWAAEHKPLPEWMIDQLQQSYLVPRKVAEDWIKTRQILPLLDGLDEVPEAYREACIDAINQFRCENGFVPVTVCCRLKDYKSIGQRLELEGAVAVKPLVRANVDDYLRVLRKPLQDVRQVLAEDETLWELLDTPLMVDILIRAYQGQPAQSLSVSGGFEARRDHLFKAYVDRMFQHRQSKPYARPRTEYWLRWLAQQLKARNQKDFLLENLQLDWLPGRRRQQHNWNYRIVVGLGGALVGGLIWGLGCRLVFGPVRGPVFGLSGRMAFGLVGWLGGGLVGGLGSWLGSGTRSLREKIEPIQTLRWSAQRALQEVALATVFGLVGGLIGWLGSALVYGLKIVIDEGLIRGEVVQTITPNQTIWASGRNGLFRGAIDGVLSGLLFGLVGGLALGLGFGLLGGLLGELTGGLSGGGDAFMRHFVLRAQLAREGFAPFLYVPFLEYATALLFLERNGGAYRFRHDLLRDYFAALTPTPDAA
jgi:hypothetical protein